MHAHKHMQIASFKIDGWYKIQLFNQMIINWLEGRCTSVLGLFKLHFLVVGDGVRIQFWEDLWWGDQPLRSQFPYLYRVVIVKNLTVSTILGHSSSFSWNFNSHHNLTNSEIEDLERLVSSLTHVHLSSSTPNAKAWSLTFSGLCTLKSFFMALSNIPTFVLFSLTKFIWKSKDPSKVKAFSWLVAHKKVNTNNML